MGNPITVPAGITLDAPQQQPQQPQIQTPAGITLDAPTSQQMTPEQAHAARAARANSDKEGMPTAADVAAQNAAPDRGTIANLAGGFQKVAAETTTGLANLIGSGLEKVLGKPAGTLQGKFQDNVEKPSVARKVGEVAGEGTEWMMGEEALGALAEFSKAAKYLKTPQMLTDYLARSPKIVQALATVTHGLAVGGTKGAIIGGVQGAVQGAAKENVAAGAKGGAEGGAIGGGVGEVVAEGVKPLMRMFDLGGLSSTEALTKAGRPYVGEQNWTENLQKAVPLIMKEDAANPVTSVGGFEDAAANAANKLWNGTIRPQIDAAAQAGKTVSGKNVATLMRNSITDEMRELFPEEADAAEAFAQKFDKTLSVDKAEKYLETLNAKLKGFYKLSPDARHAMGVTDGSISAMEQAADGLRNELYSTVGGDIREAKQQYGALKQVERVFGKRATVNDRQSPINLQQAMGAIGAVAMHNPVIAAVPVLSKLRNAPESLIRQGLSAAASEAGSPTVGGVVKGAIKEATPTVAAAQGASMGEKREEAKWVKVIAKDGKPYYIHPEDVAKAHAKGLLTPDEKSK